MDAFLVFLAAQPNTLIYFLPFQGFPLSDEDILHGHPSVSHPEPSNQAFHEANCPPSQLMAFGMVRNSLNDRHGESCAGSKLVHIQRAVQADVRESSMSKRVVTSAASFWYSSIDSAQYKQE